ncbi:phosphoglycerate kinase [Liberibacter sp. Z1]|nr:phosphoglycerate kinase [Candidatus Liberibacter sp.]
MDDLPDIAGCRVLVRVDWNVPFMGGIVSDATRIERSASTILELVERGAKIVLLSHMGRPQKQRDGKSSLRQVVPVAEDIFKKKIIFVEDCIGSLLSQSISDLSDGGIILAENIRFYPGEEDNDPDFVTMLAKNGDYYVNDAFSVSHRAHASVEGLASILPSCAGRSMQKELNMLERCFSLRYGPIVAISGGSKVSTKIELLISLAKRVDTLVICGGMANSFLASDGMDMGRSLYQSDSFESIRRVTFVAQEVGCELILPQDVVVAKQLKKGVKTETVSVRSIPEDSIALDIGHKTVEHIKKSILNAKTLIWNGPLGAFEVEPFDRATTEIARFIADLTRKGDIISVAGGGDTLAALSRAGVSDAFTYISTAGGAFFEWLEGKILPGISALTSRDRN